MTRSTTRTLAEERDRLDARLSDLVDQLDGADPDTPGGQMLVSEARDVDQAGQAVGALVAEYDDDAEVTVRPLDGKRYGEYKDRIDTLQQLKPGPGGVPGSGLNVYAAAGLVDAPFLNGDADTLIARSDAVGDLSPAPGAQLWLVDLVDDVGQVDSGNWTPLQARIAERER